MIIALKILCVICMICVICVLIHLYINSINYIEKLDTEVPGIIFLRHGEELDNGPIGLPDRTYIFGNYSRTLPSSQQTLNPTDNHGIVGAKKLYSNLNTLIRGKYKPIDTIITIDPNSDSKNNIGPTKNPFLTAYYYIYSDSGDTNNPVNNTSVKNFKLIDSKTIGDNCDGCNVADIQPSQLYSYTNGSVLIIATRDTLWGSKDVSTSNTRLLSKYQSNTTIAPIYPQKEQTVHIFSGTENNRKLEIFNMN
jgi:hypothetical protein